MQSTNIQIPAMILTAYPWFADYAPLGVQEPNVPYGYHFRSRNGKARWKRRGKQPSRGRR
jgi:hypothetical protein